jgi:mutual gliding-motility protein MglA
LSLFRRIVDRLKRAVGKESKTEETVERETEQEDLASEKKAASGSERPLSAIDLPVTPTGTVSAQTSTIPLDTERTESLAKEAKIKPRTPEEIVPGKLLKRDEEGRIHIKIVFYGPSLSGKTTALRWLFANIPSLSQRKMVEISDELGRTTFFDFLPVAARGSNIVFDVFTVAGQRRHARSRISVLKDADGIIFMADSRPESMNENLSSIEELRIALGTDRVATMPIIVALNKRDLPNALPPDYMIQMLDLEGFPVFETIATEGKNLVRMFQRVLRDSLVFKIGM